MHARWMSVVLMAGFLSFGQVFAEEDTESGAPEPVPAAADSAAPDSSAPVPATPAPSAPAPSMGGEADAAESRVGGSPPTLLSSSWWGAVQQAEQWKFAGDMALLHQQPSVAYPFYDRVAKTFPGTPHGRVAAVRGNYALYRLRHAGNYPLEEDELREIYDLLTW